MTQKIKKKRDEILKKIFTHGDYSTIRNSYIPSGAEQEGNRLFWNRLRSDLMSNQDIRAYLKNSKSRMNDESNFGIKLADGFLGGGPDEIEIARAAMALACLEIDVKLSFESLDKDMKIKYPYLEDLIYNPKVSQ